MGEKNTFYKGFTNQQCEYFPCHDGICEEEFNCLFCYCPLYALGDECGGNFTYTKSGVKNCKGCSFPHKMENYDVIQQKVKLLVEKVKK